MEPSEAKDEWLMAQVARGDRQYLEPLVRRHANPLFTFLHRLVRNWHRGEELFQEVFLTVWVKRRLYQYPRPFRTWLYAIAVNKVRAGFRKRPEPEPAEELDPSDSKHAPPDAVIAQETAGLVKAAVAKLPMQQRQVVILRVWNGLAYSEIAESLGLSEATVRSHMHHALAGLRRHLEPCVG